MSIQDKLHERPLGEGVSILKDQFVELADLSTTGLLEFWVEGGVSGLSLILLRKSVERFDKDLITKKCENYIDSMKGEEKTFQERGDFLFINFNFRCLEE